MATSRVTGQFNQASTSATGQTLVCNALPSNVTAGNALAIAVSYDTSGTAGTESVADDQSTSAISIETFNIGGFNQALGSYYYKNSVGGPRTWTLSNTVSHTNRYIGVVEIQGADQSAPLGNHNHNTAGANPAVTGNIATTLDGCYIFGYGNLNTGATENSPAVSIQNDQTNSFTWMSDYAQATHSSTTDVEWTQLGAYQAGVVAFLPASTAAAVVNTLLSIPAVRGIRPVMAMMMRQLGTQTQGPPPLSPPVLPNLLPVPQTIGIAALVRRNQENLLTLGAPSPAPPIVNNDIFVPMQIGIGALVRLNQQNLLNLGAPSPPPPVVNNLLPIPLQIGIGALVKLNQQNLLNQGVPPVAAAVIGANVRAIPIQILNRLHSLSNPSVPVLVQISIAQRKTLSATGNHVGGRQRRLSS